MAKTQPSTTILGNTYKNYLTDVNLAFGNNTSDFAEILEDLGDYDPSTSSNDTTNKLQKAEKDFETNMYADLDSFFTDKEKKFPSEKEKEEVILSIINRVKVLIQAAQNNALLNLTLDIDSTNLVLNTPPNTQGQPSPYSRRISYLDNDKQNNYSLIETAPNQVPLLSLNCSTNGSNKKLFLYLNTDTFNISVSILATMDLQNQQYKLSHYIFPPLKFSKYYDLLHQSQGIIDSPEDSTMNMITSVRFDPFHKHSEKKEINALIIKTPALLELLKQERIDPKSMPNSWPESIRQHLASHYNNFEVLDLPETNEERKLYEEIYDRFSPPPHCHFHQKQISEGSAILQNISIKEIGNTYTIRFYRNLINLNNKSRTEQIAELKKLFPYAANITSEAEFLQELLRLKKLRGNTQSFAISSSKLREYLDKLKAAYLEYNGGDKPPILKYDLGMPFLRIVNQNTKEPFSFTNFEIFLKKINQAKITGSEKGFLKLLESIQKEYEKNKQTLKKEQTVESANTAANTDTDSNNPESSNKTVAAYNISQLGCSMRLLEEGYKHLTPHQQAVLMECILCDVQGITLAPELFEDKSFTNETSTRKDNVTGPSSLPSFENSPHNNEPPITPTTEKDEDEPQPGL